MKTKLNAMQRLLLTAMPKGKKVAERKVAYLSDTLFVHVLKLVMLGYKVPAGKKWLKEVRDKCMTMQDFASNTEQGSLNWKWVYGQIFLDFAKNSTRLATRCLHIADMNDEYRCRFDPRGFEEIFFKKLSMYFEQLAQDIVDSRYNFESDSLYNDLKELVDSFKQWEK